MRHSRRALLISIGRIITKTPNLLDRFLKILIFLMVFCNIFLKNKTSDEKRIIFSFLLYLQSEKGTAPISDQPYKGTKNPFETLVYALKKL